MPLPTGHVIGPGWSAHHQPVAEGAMGNATVEVGNVRNPATYDPTDDDTTGTWPVTWAGPARIQAQLSATQQDVAGQPMVGRGYLVQIPASSPRIRTGARVKVTSARNDAALVGEELWVIDFQMGSERFTRDLICSDNQADIPA
jgi:hypothetical protein